MTLIYFLRKYIISLIDFEQLIEIFYFLVEDILKERIHPYPNDTNSCKSFTVHEVKTFSRHASPVPPSQPPQVLSTAVPAPPPTPPPSPPTPAVMEDTAIPIPTAPVIQSFPRLPTPPSPHPISPFIEKPATPPVFERIPSPPFEKPATPILIKPVTPPVERNIPQFQDSPPPYVSNSEKLRQGILN